MPQMMPLNWLTLPLIFLCSYMVLLCWLSFSYSIFTPFTTIFLFKPRQTIWPW